MRSFLYIFYLINTSPNYVLRVGWLIKSFWTCAVNLRTFMNKDCWNALLMNWLVVDLMAEEKITKFSFYFMDQ